MKKQYCIPLDEEKILKLPFYAYPADCIHLTSQRKGEKYTTDVLTKNNNTFSINLSHSINKLKNKKISELKYYCGKHGSIKIYLCEDGHLSGEYSTQTKECVINLIKKLSIF